MSAILDACGNDTGSPSISKAEDNLSNSDGPLIKGYIRQNSCSSVHIRCNKNFILIIEYVIFIIIIIIILVARILIEQLYHLTSCRHLTKN